jgi:predicted nucleotidyltransferase
MRHDTVRPEKNKPLEPLIIATIVKHIKPQRIILFGSRARGDAQERADYDIAIDGENLTPVQLAQIRADLETLPTLLSIDVVWMNRVTDKLRRRILDEGKVLYER